MNPHIEWTEVALRLALASAAGALIGFERGDRGRAAGLRTTILVCVAAAVSMIQVNLMLGMAGRASDSFIKLDLMRLPLGILSGIGFIGAGAILQRGNLVTGVTTAASLWYVTVMGLCLGGGQLGLGIAMLVIGMLVLTVLKKWEDCMLKEQRGLLLISIGEAGPTENEIRSLLLNENYRTISCYVSHVPKKAVCRYRLKLRWRARDKDDVRTPDFVSRLSEHPGVDRVDWRPGVF